MLLASGAVVAIKDIQLGDMVVASDPETGQTNAEPVTVLHLNLDVELADVAVSLPAGADGSSDQVAEGKGGRSTRGPTATIKTTADHPFWDATAQQWVGATDLIPGQSTLVTDDGQVVDVVSVRTYHGERWMHNLTVANLHTYYVLADNTPVLVHNIDEDEICKLTLGPDGSRPAEGISATHGDRVLPHEQEFINLSGNKHGCATCGARTSGYADGHWTADHTPPYQLAPEGPWTLYSHCKPCTKRQGGIVNALKRGWYEFKALLGGDK